tara:strand:- start:13456 stop:13584 length:129 start_codon:yes stop_codon:yes gene_type:complete
MQMILFGPMGRNRFSINARIKEEDCGLPHYDSEKLSIVCQGK